MDKHWSKLLEEHQYQKDSIKPDEIEMAFELVTIHFVPREYLLNDRGRNIKANFSIWLSNSLPCKIHLLMM